VLIWVLVFAGIAVVGAVVIALLVRRLLGKASAVFTELDVLLGQLDQLAELVSGLEIPDRLLEGFDDDGSVVVRPSGDVTVAASRHAADAT
jgi:hypothetical protein